MKSMVEICCNSLQSALNAQRAGADRIELCVSLGGGGVTPSLGLIEEVIAQLSIPVYVLVRPREGDFVYTDEEIKVMLREIVWCKQSGVMGIVTGILNEEREVDFSRMQILIDAIGDLDWTFHRAFDVVKNSVDAIQTLKALGCKRILTSGRKECAVDGIENIIEWKEIAQPEISLMVGGNVVEENISEIIKATGIHEIHFSAKAEQYLYEDEEVGQYISFTHLGRAKDLVALAKKAFEE